MPALYSSDFRRQHMSEQNSVVIVAGARTPMGGFGGSLASVSATDLGAIAIEEAVKRAGIDAADVEEVIMGNVLPAGLKQGPARQAMRKAGLPDATGATTINKLCGSGMKATMMAHDAIKAGSVQIAVSGGMESMSNAPYVLEGVRTGFRMGAGSAPQDHMFLDGLQDAETGKLMGAFAQEMADKKGYTREQMDNYAIQSLTRAKDAIEKGLNNAEIVPVTVTSRKGETVVDNDEQPFNANIEKIPTLRPAFAKDGTITAANASSISDGASALVLMSEAAANDKGVKPLARIVAHATQSQHPSEFTVAPVGAIEKVLAKAGWSKDDVDLFEINEAFAMVAMMPIDELKLDINKVNIYGGACAQGHPVGSTGSRLIVTLMNALKNTGGTKGVAALCIGGGEATAIAIELV
jgi:acetyl-CoA C-acetyltransferase